MKQFLFLSALLFTACLCNSQIINKSSISGFIRTEMDSAVRGAIILMLHSSDSTLVTARTSDETGKFQFGNIPYGQYFFRISHVGYSELFTQVFKINEPVQSLNSLILKLNTAILSEVIVSAQRPLIEQMVDATVLNLNEIVRKEAVNAFEVLRFAPNLNLDENEEQILMNGKTSVDVMINGKLVRFAGRELVKLLKGISSISVAQVEVITNPSSKYDVSGNTGIINIKLKKPVAGVNGNFNVTHTKAINNLGDISGTLNYGKGKIYLTTYLAYHYGKYQTKAIETQLYEANSVVETLTRNKTDLDRWSDPVVRLSADWFINPKHTIGGLAEFEKSSNKSTYQTFVQRTSQPDSTLSTRSNMPNTRNWKTFNLNYRYSDPKGGELNFDIDRSNYKKVGNNLRIGEIIHNYINTPFSTNKFENNTVINLQTFKGDYTKTYSSKVKIEAGAKLSLVRTKNNQVALYSGTGTMVIDTARTNYFKYDENIQAVYGTISKQYKKWSFLAGVRIEHSKTLGTAIDLKKLTLQKPDTSYINVLPSLYLNYSPSSLHKLRLSFIQRIKRPNYEDIQPFEYQIDQFLYHLSNTGLRSQKNSNIELNYTYKGKLNFASSFVHTTDYFTNVLFQRGGISYEILQNTGESKAFNFITGYPVRPAKWWSSENRITITNNQFKGLLLDGYLDATKWSYNLFTSQRFTLPKEYILRLTARYAAPQQKLYFIEESSGSVGMSIGKQFLDKKATLRIGASDLFFTQRSLKKVNFNSFNTTSYSTWESRGVFLDFSFRFGSTKIKEPRERQTGNVDEKDRAK